MGVTFRQVGLPVVHVMHTDDIYNSVLLVLEKIVEGEDDNEPGPCPPLPRKRLRQGSVLGASQSQCDGCTASPQQRNDVQRTGYKRIYFAFAVGEAVSLRSTVIPWLGDKAWSCG